MTRREVEEEEIFEETKIDLEAYGPLKIFEGSFPVPPGFNGLTISLDASLESELEWSKAIELADRAIENGFLILWNLDFGLFDRLMHPLCSESQFLSFSLALTHFRETIWTRFKEHSVGFSVYKGPVFPLKGFPWSEDQKTQLFGDATDVKKEDIDLFCGKSALYYIRQLGGRLPEGIPHFLFLDMTAIEGVEELLSFLRMADLSSFELCVKGSKLPLNAFGWQEPSLRGFVSLKETTLLEKKEVYLGVLIPELGKISSAFLTCLNQLASSKMPFRLIKEEKLTMEWDGLDAILYSPQSITLEGKRKLKGFVAAGGKLLVSEKSDSSSCEESFNINNLI